MAEMNNYGYQPRVLWKNEYLSFDTEGTNSAPPTTIMPTDLTVSASVNIVFEIL